MIFSTKPSRREIIGGGIYLALYIFVMPWLVPVLALLADGRLITSGGRVLGVTAVRPDLADAIEASYGMLDEIDFANKYYRADIGQKALRAFNRE